MQLRRELSVRTATAGFALAAGLAMAVGTAEAAPRPLGLDELPSQVAIGVNLDTHRGLLNTVHARIDHRYRESARMGTPRRSFTFESEDAYGDYANAWSFSGASMMTGQLDTQFTALWPTASFEAMQETEHLPAMAAILQEDETRSGRMQNQMSASPRLRISRNYGGMWFEGFGLSAKQEEDVDLTGYKLRSGGFSVGLDSHAAENWIFGGMVGYSIGNADLFHDKGYVDGDTVYTGIYMANISTTHFANLFLTAAVTDFEAGRNVIALPAYGTARDEFGSYMWDARLELGRTFGMFDDDFIRPNIAIEYTSVFHDDYIDDGKSIVPGVMIEDHTTKLVRSEANVDMLFGSQTFDDHGWSSRIFVGVAHEIYLDSRETDVTVTGLAPYKIGLGDDHRTFGMIGASLSLAVNQRMRTQLSYQGEANTDFERHNVVLGFSVAW